MKKLLSLVLVLVMVCGLAVTAQAAKIDVSTDAKTVGVGEDVIVTVALAEDISVEEGATMLQGELKYDSAVLEFQEIVEKSAQLSNAAKHKTDSRVLFNYLSMDSSAVGFTKGTLVKIRFKAVADIAASHVDSAMSFTAYVQNAQGQDVADLNYPASVSVVVSEAHTWDEGKVETEPTCAKPGVKVYTCTFSGCGETRTEDIPATGEHSYSKVVTEPTCEKGGYTTYTCQCGDTYTADETEALGHKMGEYEVTKEPTYTEKGEETAKCENCDHTDTREISMLEKPEDNCASGHTWDQGKVTAQPTCTKPGVRTLTCTVCGESKCVPVAALGHDWDHGKVTVQPTCTRDGVKTYCCTNKQCHASWDEPVKALGHRVDPKVWKSDAANHWHECQICGEKADVHAHNGGTATVTEKAKCELCGTAYGSLKAPTPQTGDNSMLGVFAVVLALSGAMAAALLTYRKRRMA